MNSDWLSFRKTPIAVILTLLWEPLAGATTLQEEFPFLAKSPFPRQHVDARNSDFVPGVWAPTAYQQAWHVLEDRAYTQPCANGREGNIYCVSFHDPKEKCNFTALDSQSGKLRWDDRVNGQCLLDEAAAISVPLVDVDGHVYIPDSSRIVSFTADGQLRWINETPATLQAQPATGRSNAPFGLNVLPTGELVSMTIGDGFILVIDRTTGELLVEPFDLPAMKVKAGDTPPPPEGLLENLGSSRCADIIWEFSMGESNNETDNDVSVDTHTGAIFITSAAPPLNPHQDGALWETPGVRFFRRDEKGFIPMQIHMVTSVVTVYENVAILALSALNMRGIDWDDINPLAPFVGDARTAMVAIDIQKGSEVFNIPDAGELHTASLAADGKTLISTEFNMVIQMFGDRSTPAGVRGWVTIASK